MIIRFAGHHLLASSSSFMTDSMYLGTIQSFRNFSKQYYYLISTTSMIWQIDANCSLLHSLSILPFYLWLEHSKLIYCVYCGVMVYWLSILHNFIQLSLNSASNPAHSVLGIPNGEDFWQWSRLEIRLTIPQKQFIVIIISNFSKYYFKTGTTCTLFLSSHAFTNLRVW